MERGPFCNTELKKLAYDKGYREFLNPRPDEIQKWLREKHKINVIVHLGLHPIGPATEFYNGTYIFQVANLQKSHDIYAAYYDKTQFHTYEEALEAGLIYALNLIE